MDLDETDAPTIVPDGFGSPQDEAPTIVPDDAGSIATIVPEREDEVGNIAATILPERQDEAATITPTLEDDAATHDPTELGDEFGTDVAESTQYRAFTGDSNLWNYRTADACNRESRSRSAPRRAEIPERALT